MRFTAVLLVLSIAGLTLCYEQFCRCECDSEYKIIPLKDEGCSACTKNYCSELNLKECKGIKEERILTTCFQRESTKDQLIVYTFILVAFGFLAYAIFGKALMTRRG